MSRFSKAQGQSQPGVWFAFMLLLALFNAGCATPAPAKLSLERYKTDPNRLHVLAVNKTVLVCMTFDGLDETVRAQYDPAFSTTGYITDAIEQELGADHVKNQRASFAFAPTFDGLQGALSSGAVSTADTVVLASSLIHFARLGGISCDFRVYSNSGKLLFAKRGLCIGAAPPIDLQMVLRQILDDPELLKALQ